MARKEMESVILLFSTLVLSVTFTYAEALRIAWLVPGPKSTCQINVETSIAAVRLALKSVSKTSIHSGGKTIGIKYFETDCDAKSATIAMLQQSAYDPDVIVGPPCHEAMKTVGRLATFANLPVFGWYNPSTDFEDISTYPTLIKLMPSVRILATSLKHIMNQNGWSKFPMLYEKTELGSHIRQGIEEEVAMATELQLLGALSVSDRMTTVNLYKTLRNMKRRAKIIVLACSKSLVRRILLVADKAEMTGGRFVFIHLDYQVYTGEELTRDVMSDRAWRKDDADDVDARRAFAALIHVVLDPVHDGAKSFSSEGRTIPRSKYAEFSRLVSTESGPINQDWHLPKATAQSDLTPDVHSMYLYDSILVWSVLSEVLNKTGLGHRNGRVMARLAKSFKSEGITGSIEFNSNMERIGTTYVLKMDPRGTFKPVQVLKFNKTGIPDVTTMGSEDKIFSLSSKTKGLKNRPFDDVPSPTKQKQYLQTSRLANIGPANETKVLSITTPSAGPLKPQTTLTTLSWVTPTSLKPTISKTSTAETTPSTTGFRRVASTTQIYTTAAHKYTHLNFTTLKSTTSRPTSTSPITSRSKSYITKSTAIWFPTTTPKALATITKTTTTLTPITRPPSPFRTRNSHRKMHRPAILKKDAKRTRKQYSEADVDNLAEFQAMLQSLIQMRQPQGNTPSPPAQGLLDDNAYSRQEAVATKELPRYTGATISKPLLKKNPENRSTSSHTDTPFLDVDSTSQQLLNQYKNLSREAQAGQVIVGNSISASEMNGIITNSAVKRGSFYKDNVKTQVSGHQQSQQINYKKFNENNTSINPIKNDRPNQQGSLSLDEEYGENTIGTQSKDTLINEITHPSELPRANLWNSNAKTIKTSSPYGKSLFPTDVLGFPEVPGLSEFRSMHGHSDMASYGLLDSNNKVGTMNMLKASEVEHSFMTNHGLYSPKTIKDSVASSTNKHQKRFKQSVGHERFDKSTRKLTETSFTLTSTATTSSPFTTRSNIIISTPRKPLSKSQDVPRPDAVNLIMQKLLKLEAFIKKSSREKAILQTTSSSVDVHGLNELRNGQYKQRVSTAGLQNGVVWGSTVRAKNHNKTSRIKDDSNEISSLRRTLIKTLRRHALPNQTIITTAAMPTMQHEGLKDIVTSQTSEFHPDTGDIQSQETKSSLKSQGPMRRNTNKHVLVNSNRGTQYKLTHNSDEKSVTRRISRNRPIPANTNDIDYARVSKYTVKQTERLADEPPKINAGIQYGHIISKVPLQKQDMRTLKMPSSRNKPNVVSNNASNLLIERLSANVVERVTNEITKEIIAASLKGQNDTKYAIHIVSDWVPSMVEEEPPQLKMTLHINKTRNKNNSDHTKTVNKVIQLDTSNVAKALTNLKYTKRPTYFNASNEPKRLRNVSSVSNVAHEEDFDQHTKKSNQQTNTDQQADKSAPYTTVQETNKKTILDQHTNSSKQQSIANQQTHQSKLQTSSGGQTEPSKKKSSGLKISLASIMSSWGPKARPSKRGMPRMPPMPSRRGIPPMSQMAMMMRPPGYGTRRQQPEASEAEESGGSQQPSYGHPSMYQQPPPMYPPHYPQQPPYPQPPAYQQSPQYPQPQAYPHPPYQHYPQHPYMPPPPQQRLPMYQPPPGYRTPSWPPGGGGYPPPYAMPHMPRGPPSWPGRPSRRSRMAD